MTTFDVAGTPAQRALVERALARCDYPFAALPGNPIPVGWADLSRAAAAALAVPVERDVDGRRRVLGLYYPPPYERILLDVSLEADPDLAAEVLLAEAAHAVDYRQLRPRGLRRAVWDALHPDQPPLTVEPPESGDVAHGHSWFDGPAGYETWVGEAFMAAFVRAFSDVPDTFASAHPVSAAVAAEVRRVLLDQPSPPPGGRVFRGRRRTVYHDAHRGVAPVEWYDTAAAAAGAGLRPCGVCRPR